jgi:hypothetical protein
MGAKQELADVEAFFGQYVGHKSKLVAKITKALAFHRKEIMGDVEEVESDFHNGDYVASGKVAADLVAVALGKIESDLSYDIFLQ